MPSDDPSTEGEAPSPPQVTRIRDAPLSRHGGSRFSGHLSAGGNIDQGNKSQNNNNNRTLNVYYDRCEFNTHSSLEPKGSQFEKAKNRKSIKNSTSLGNDDSPKPTAYHCRVTKMEVTESQETICDLIRSFSPEGAQLCTDKRADRQIPRGLDSNGYQTAVAMFKRRPSNFPKRGDDLPLSRNFWFTFWRRGEPLVDAHFHGLTTLSSPSYEPTNVCLSTHAESSGRGKSRPTETSTASTQRHPEPTSPSPWAKYYKPGLSRDIRYDLFSLVILAPLGKHPYESWIGGPLGEDMWVVDFLEKEGFDATRISIFGAKNWNRQEDGTNNMGKELTEALRSLKNLECPELGHYIILVELQPDTVMLLNEETIDDLRNSFKGKLDVLQIRLDEESAPLFTRNDNTQYRELVGNIWKLVHALPLASQPEESSWSLTWPSAASQVPVKLELDRFHNVLERMCGLIDKSKAVNPSNHRRKDIQNDEDFFGILGSEQFQAWLGNSSASMRIVGSHGCKVRALCSSLSEFQPEHRVFHLDCETLSGECSLVGGRGTGNSVIGPLILWISKMVVEAPMREDYFGCLLDRLSAKANVVRYCVNKAEDPFDQLVLFTEQLGSTMVQVIAEALNDCLAPRGAAPPLMLILSGLHVFRRSPELGRLIYCISRLHESINKHRVCRLLVTHDQRQDFDGLLRNFACLRDGERDICLHSLQTNTPRPSRSESSIDERHGGTLSWFRDSSEYNKWKQPGRSSVLLLYGKPACGKSVFSRFILEDLRKDNSKIVAHFFFQNVGHDPAKPEAANDHRDMLQALLYHILQQAPELFPHFQSAFREVEKAANKNSEVTWEISALKQIVEKLTRHPFEKTLYILVDGLDEASDGISCAVSLGEFLSEGSKIAVKLLVATQCKEPATKKLKDRIREVEKRFPEQGDTILNEMTLQEKNSKDILEYTQSFLNERCAMDIDWTRDDIDDCREILIQKANGIFLWLKLAKEHVNGYCESSQEASFQNFKNFLSDIPDEVMDLYKKLFDRMIDNIKLQKYSSERDRQVRRVRNMFQVAISARGPPLLLEEFRDAYLVPRPEEWDAFSIKDARPANAKQTISEFTANFLEVRRNGPEDTVQLLHQSAAMFLQGERIEGEPLCESGHGDDLSTMASACMFYLRLVSQDLEDRMDLGRPRSPLDRREEIGRFAEAIHQYPLLPYAIAHTAGHVNMRNSHQRGKLVELLAKMKESNIRFLLRSWINDLARQLGLGSEHLVPLSKHCDEKEFANSLLHVATTKRLVTAVRVALKVGANPRSRSTLYDSREHALSLLAKSSPPPPANRAQLGPPPGADVIICRLLIEHDAEVDALTQHQGTALHYAGKHMKDDLVEELIRHHAQVNYRDSQDMTPLHRAVIGPSQESTASTEFDARGRPPRFASEKCIETLIRSGADLHAGDSQGLMPIHWAAGLKNRVPILELLIKGHSGQGSKKNAAKRASNKKCLYKHATPLHWASGHGYEENIRVLIRQGASIDWADDTGRTALHWAARYGHALALNELLKALKAAGKDVEGAVNRRELDGRTPLIWACQWGHVECVRLLIDAGADVNLSQGGQDGNDIGGSPLSWAVTWGHTKVIELLIKKGADIDPPGEEKRPLLSWAALSGNTETFDLIWDIAEARQLKLDVDMADGRGKTPFMIAAAHGHLHMVQHLDDLLRNRKISRRACDDKGNTALHLAASWNHGEMVEWLIENAQIGVNERNHDGCTALCRAEHYCAEKSTSVLRLSGGRREPRCGFYKE